MILLRMQVATTNADEENQSRKITLHKHEIGIIFMYDLYVRRLP